MKQPVSITVHTLVHAPLPMVWQYWTEPQHIKNWNSASPDWETTQATSDLTAGGRFSYAMQAKDGSTGFAFSGTFVEVTPQQLLAFQLDDGRQVRVIFAAQGTATALTETFDAEQYHTAEQQQSGWQSILDHFKAYTEAALQ